MAGLRVWDSPRRLPAPVLNRQQGMRRVLFGTLAGRAIVVGLAIKLLVASSAPPPVTLPHFRASSTPSRGSESRLGHLIEGAAGAV